MNMNSKILDFDWMEINIQLILSKFTTPCIQRGHHTCLVFLEVKLFTTLTAN